jgi:Uma2 family endonuclease
VIRRASDRIAPEDRLVLIHDVDWEVYERILEALGEYHIRHAYDRGTLEMRAVLYGVSWRDYQKFLDALGDKSPRHSYDRGTLEMMSPGKDHDWVSRLIGRFIQTMSPELNIPIQSVGSTTLGREVIERGLQPDEAYYIANEPRVRGRLKYDPKRDPPPDLIVEVEVTRDAVSRLPLLAALGVPEIWRHSKEGIAFYRLGSKGKYVKTPRSIAFPLLRPADINRFLRSSSTIDETSLVRSFVEWVRAQADKS